MRVCTYVNVRPRKYVCLRDYLCTRLLVYACTCAHVSVCMRVCVRMYVCMCTCKCLRAYADACAYVLLRMYTYAHRLFKYVLLCTLRGRFNYFLWRPLLYVLTYIRMCVQRCVRKSSLMYIHTYMCTSARARTYARAPAHTYTHVHTYVCVHVRVGM